MPVPSAPARDYRQHLEVETPEHVVLDLEIAGVGSRALAAILDMILLTGSFLGVMTVLAIIAGYGLTVGRLGGAILLLGGFAAWTGYFIFFEGLRQGQTPGKRAVGIRVVMDTGYAVTLSAAVARNLLRTADFLPPPYLIGAVLVALHPRAKRLGDMVAGTVVARDRPAETGAVRPKVEAPGHSDTLPELTDAEFQLVAQYAAREAQLAPGPRARLAAAIAGRLSAHPAPPGVPAADHLLDLHTREQDRRRGTLAVRTAGAAARFVARKRERWDEFQRLAERAAARGLDSFAAHELPDFAARYREVAADLARARTYGCDEATRARLERLAAAGHNALYREERNTWGRIWEVLARECPAAVVAARSYVLVAFLCFAAPAAAGYVVLRQDPGLAAEVLPEVMLRRAEAGTAR